MLSGLGAPGGRPCLFTVTTVSLSMHNKKGKAPKRDCKQQQIMEKEKVDEKNDLKEKEKKSLKKTGHKWLQRLESIQKHNN